MKTIKSHTSIHRTWNLIMVLLVTSTLTLSFAPKHSNDSVAHLQEVSCLEILQEVHQRTGFVKNLNYSDEDGQGSCTLTFVDHDVEGDRNTYSYEFYNIRSDALYEFQVLDAAFPEELWDKSPLVFHGYEGQVMVRHRGEPTVTYVYWFVPGPDLMLRVSLYQNWYSNEFPNENDTTPDWRPFAETLHAVLYERWPELGLAEPDPVYRISNPLLDPRNNEDPALQEFADEYDLPTGLALGSLTLPVLAALAGSILAALQAGGLAPQLDGATKYLNKIYERIEKVVRKQIIRTQMEHSILENDLRAIDVQLKDQKKYVLNPYQGDPTLIGHGVLTALNMGLNKTAGLFTGQEALTCGGYTKATEAKLVEALRKHFPGAKLQQMVFKEHSTLHDKESWGNWLDSIVDDNHTLHKVTLPDGSQWAVDFHQYNAGKAPLMRPWQDAVKEWKEYMGKDFSEYEDHTVEITPLPENPAGKP